MVPPWLHALSVASLVIAAVCALVMVADIVVLRRRQEMAVMNVTWPVAGLYLGPVALAAYYWFGRARPSGQGEGGGGDAPEKPYWQSVFLDATHCGGGCVLGDVIGEWVVFLLGVTLAGVALWPEYIADFALAYLFGIAFQYFAIVPMRKLPPGKGLVEAIKADTVSLIAYELGMFAWMAVVFFVLFHPHLQPLQPTYWMMMQIAMIVGFATTFPANWWLVKAGIKDRM